MPLQASRRKSVALGLFAGCVVCVVIYNLLAIRVYLSHRFSMRMDQPSLQRAVDLEPRDAAPQDLLGRYLLFNAENQSAAVVAIKRAIALNPYNASYWLDLGQADLASGAQVEEQYAINRALAADPTTPEVAWNAANLFVFQGEVERALPEYAIVLQHSPRLAAPALSQCWQAVRDTKRIFPILPRDPSIYLQFLHLLTSSDEKEAAAQVWTALLGLNERFDFHDGLFYIDYLLQGRQADEADEAWRQLALISPELAGYRQPGNLVVDGIFSGDILNAGFGWHYAQIAGVRISLDGNEHYGAGSNRSVSITYTDASDGPNLYQDVAVRPDTMYRLSAAVKSDNLQAANGPALGAVDPYSNLSYAMTNTTLGTTDWHKVWKDFKSGPETRLVEMRILRKPADTAIRGTFWIDDISLRPIGAANVTSK